MSRCPPQRQQLCKPDPLRMYGDPARLAGLSRKSVSSDPTLAALGVRYLQIGGDWWNRCSDGWLNIDQAFSMYGMREGQVATDDNGAHNMVLSIRADTVLPFASESVQMVYAEHVLEHMLPSAGGLRLVQEAYRLLVPGGVLRIATPDLALYMCGYSKPQPNNAEQAHFLQRHAMRFEPMERIAGRKISRSWSVLGGQNRQPSEASIVNNIFRNYGHQWIYDLDEVKLLAEGAGIDPSYVCRSDRSQHGLPPQLRRAIKRALDPRNASKACWLDQAVREDESLYVHIYKVPNWSHVPRNYSRPFCRPMSGDWFPCRI
ncbi:hypothetical protein AB1Y20_005923 [Prymnesium parvum]|uniref:Methyltransferase type 11 domain-containing protein n=1 Tax=Prymnesium parvum TaxID=97485 RepID=A0AB34J3I4_PRYPA